jgi:hypothetical protein
MRIDMPRTGARSPFRLSGQAGAAALLSAGLLAGCAGETADVAFACPPAQIAVPADRVGVANEAGELRYVIAITDLLSQCQRADDEIEVQLSFKLIAQRGPAFETSPVPATYFVATMDPNREIVAKRVMTTQLVLVTGETQGGVLEELIIRLPVSTDVSGANYSLYLGLQPDQPLPSS